MAVGTFNDVMIYLKKKKSPRGGNLHVLMCRTLKKKKENEIKIIIWN